MSNLTRIGRLGGVAVGVGIGAAMAASPGTAGADPSVPPFDPNDFAVSIDGLPLIQVGNGTANSGFGDIAIADGFNSDAIANSGIFPFDFALPDGANSVADSAGGSFDSSTALGTDIGAYAFGSFDYASVFGTNAEAEAVDGIGDLASVDNTGTTFDEAVAGGPGLGVFGSFDIASIVGTGSAATAGEPGNFDLAAVFGDMLDAVASGNNFMADILP